MNTRTTTSDIPREERRFLTPPLSRLLLLLLQLSAERGGGDECDKRRRGTCHVSLSQACFLALRQSGHGNTSI
jgi:hypothetical protein